MSLVALVIDHLIFPKLCHSSKAVGKEIRDGTEVEKEGE